MTEAFNNKNAYQFQGSAAKLDAITSPTDRTPNRVLTTDAAVLFGFSGESIKNLEDAPQESGVRTVISSFYSDNQLGGGSFKWEASENKASHNGITIIDPVRVAAWDGTASDLSTYYATGSGTGCFVRTENTEVLSVETSGAVGDGATDCSTAISEGLKAGVKFWLSGTYLVTQRVSIPSNSGLLSDRTGSIYAPSANFNETNFANKYGNSAVVLDCSGQTSSPFTPSTNIEITGITVYTDVSDGRILNAIVGRNCQNLVIKDNIIHSLPVGCGVKLSSVTKNSKVVGNEIRDFTSNTDFSPQAPQLTAIEIDEDRINSVSSEKILIADNEIDNITVGATFIAAHNYQTDGINVAVPDSDNIIITNNRISLCGEGIDHFGKNGVISNNVIENVKASGIKLVNGASYNTITGNTVRGADVAGILIAGSASVAGGTNSNTITGNTIIDIDPDNITAGTSSCIETSDNGGVSKPNYNIVSNNTLNPGVNGKFCIARTSSGVNNTYLNNTFVQSGTTTYVGGSEASVTIPSNKSVVRGYLSGAQTVAGSSGNVKIQFDTVTESRTGEFDTTTNYRFTPDIPGRYKVYCQIRFAVVTNNSVVVLTIRKNGVDAAVRTFVATPGSDFSLNVSDIVDCVLGDHIEFFIDTGDTTPRAITNNIAFTFFNIEQVG